ncbi:F-box protein [Diplonema papillatum]|nr:F-box protein [Diplonema papillatum]
MFVGGEGTGSGLHIDNSDTHFVMHMLHGVKDFRFLGPHDRILGYEDREEGTFTTDIFNPDFEKHPLLALATVYETTIYPGDFLFMPGGSAHQTINREGGAVAISSNYIDASNLVRCTTAFDEKHRYDLSDDLRRRAAQKLSVTRMDVVDTPWPKLFPEYAVAP